MGGFHHLFLSDFQVFIHNPHKHMGSAAGRMETSRDQHDLAMLNINQRVTALVAGDLSGAESGAAAGRDVVLIGTPTNVLAYDVEKNADLFYKGTVK